MSCFYKILPVIAVLLTLQCKSSSRTTVDSLEKPEHVPTLAAVFAEKNLFSLYARDYAGFQFTSQTHQVFDAEDEGVPRKALSTIESDEKGNLHLIRVPLFTGPKIELIYLDRHAFLRQGIEEKFRSVRYLEEFDRWVNGSFREVFDLFRNEHFGEDQPFTEDSFSCWKKHEGLLCVDPATGLPLKGHITVAHEDHPPLRVEFAIIPAKPGSVLIALPTPEKEE